MIALALLWLRVSFATATTLHAILIAGAKSLPAWMQLLHPFATFIDKSKLLVLPVYPAAWPQAERGAVAGAYSVGRTGDRIGLAGWRNAMRFLLLTC